MNRLLELANVGIELVILLLPASDGGGAGSNGGWRLGALQLRLLLLGRLGLDGSRGVLDIGSRHG